MLQSLGTWRLRHNSELNNNKNNSKHSLEMFGQCLGCVMGRRNIGWNICSVGLTSGFILLGKKKKISNMCILVPAHSRRPGAHSWNLPSVISRMEGGRKASASALCLRWLLWQPLIPDFTCFSSCLGEVSEEQKEGEGFASTKQTFCLSLGQLPSFHFSLGEAELLEDVQLWSSGSSETLRGDGSIPDFCGALI